MRMPRRRTAPAPDFRVSAEARAAPQESEQPDRPNTSPFAGFGWSPRDMLIPYILLAVSLQRAHGYLIEEYLKSLGFFGLEMSTLYRTLRQLERDGLLLSAWEPGPTGPARRVYSLTDAGRAWLDTWASMLEVYRGMIDRFFGLYTRAHAPPTSGAFASQSDQEETQS
jgi:PadR family transcriptional regulator PadR